MNPMQQVYHQQRLQQQPTYSLPQQNLTQPSQETNQNDVIMASLNESDEESQTQLASLKNDSDPNYRLPPNYPIVEYSNELIVMPGNIVIQTTDMIPDGYLLCDGSMVSRETESTLFDMIGTFYGKGDGSTTFCLPDLEDDERPHHHYMIKR